MTMVAYALVYGLVWLLFDETSDNQWSPADQGKFVILTISLTCVGIIPTVLFHVFIKEHPQEIKSTKSEDRPKEAMIWKDWLKEGQFYIVGLGYVGSRLISTLSLTYWSLYTSESLQLSKKYQDIIPVIVYLSGFLTSLVMKRVNSTLGREPTYLLGCLITAGALLWIAIINQSTAQQIFGPAVIIGIGSTVLLVTSLSMIADVIGNHTNSSAFVYGVISFVDRLFIGVTVVVIQALQPQCRGCFEMAVFFKDVMSYVLISFDIVCFLLFFAIAQYSLGKLRKFSRDISSDVPLEQLKPLYDSTSSTPNNPN